MTPAQTSAWKRLRRLLPFYAPGKGWLYQLQKIEAVELGGPLLTQIQLAEQMTKLGVYLSRRETTPTWTAPASAWLFTQTAEPGAGGAWLDLWGSVYAVGRWTAETDARYASRILATVTRPTSTNLGMAQALDEALGIPGTIVQDSQDALKGPRYNDQRSRFNGTRLAAVPTYPLDWYWSTFRVFLPGGVSASSAVLALIDRFKAAGTRVLEVIETGVTARGYGHIYGFRYGGGSE